MNRTHQIKFKQAGLFGIVGGSLLAGFSVFAPHAPAQTSAVNPCPSIYYEEPFNSYVSSPEGCPPNARVQTQQGIAPAVPGQGGTYPSQDDVGLGTESAPLTNQPGSQNYPYEQDWTTTTSPIARVEPTNGVVDIQMMNSTNIPIYYEVTGETERRIISAQEEAYLQNIPLPATITTVRTDDGFLQIVSEQNSEGVLELSLEENAAFDDTQGVIRIQSDGQVFIN